MYSNIPVKIPKVKGITLRTKETGTYVQYEIERSYNRDKQYTVPTRREIGVVIPGKPDMMLPNENYEIYFEKEAEKERESLIEKGTGKGSTAAVERYMTKREKCFMLKDFFDQLYFEFQSMSRRNGGRIVNENKVKRLNRVLAPLLEMMKREEYAAFLETIPEPEMKTDENGVERMEGMTYGDVALLMTQYKGALNQFFQKNR